MSNVPYKVDYTRQASRLLEDCFSRLEFKILRSTVRSARVEKIEGQAFLVFNDQMFAIRFESNLRFRLRFVVSLDNEIDLEGRLDISEADLKCISSCPLDPKWKIHSVDFIRNQAFAVSTSGKCRSYLGSLYQDYLDGCDTHFLKVNASSEVVDHFGTTLEGSLLQGSLTTRDSTAGDDLDSDSESDESDV